jgi:WS/DGAT/MGAT family acyltransferase
MPDRLTTLDVSYLYLEQETTPMHVGAVAILEPAENGHVDLEALQRMVAERMPLVPRYRQKLRMMPARLGNPIWIDDPDFDISYHVRRTALPYPGTYEQLRALVGRLVARPLDRSRPLWEMYLVEGLEGGRAAVINKTHHAMVDGVAAVEIGSVLLDLTPEPRPAPPDDWDPAPEPSSLALVAGLVDDWVHGPVNAVEAARAGVASLVAEGAGDVARVGGWVKDTVGGVLAAAGTQLRPAPSSPLNVNIGTQRRFGMVSTDLDDYKRVRKAHGGTVNDVVLAVVAGALRSWLMTRGEPVLQSTTQRAMIPVSVRSEGPNAEQLGNKISALFVDLPIGEPDPVIRLHRLSYETRAHKESGESVAADAIVAMAGFAPPTLHAMGARISSQLSRRLFNVVVTNVPGPQFPLFSAGSRMRSVFPVVPLARGQALTIGLTSYCGGVYYGLNADFDAMPDVDVLAHCIEEAVDELVSTVG